MKKLAGGTGVAGGKSDEAANAKKSAQGFCCYRGDPFAKNMCRSPAISGEFRPIFTVFHGFVVGLSSMFTHAYNIQLISTYFNHVHETLIGSHRIDARSGL